MAVNQTLTLWAKLLVAEYGRTRVIAALAEAEDVEIEAIEQEVEAVRQRKFARRRRRPKTLAELLGALRLEPEAHALVKEIGCAYQNKRYLGELWRVKRFLADHGVEADKLRSRAAAFPIIIDVLGEMAVGELTEIAGESKEPARGDLGILTDQILGTEGNTPEVAHPTSASAAKDHPR